MREIQKSFTGTSADGARSTQDKAWEGTTGDDAATGGGAGISDGGAGIVTSPSLDNVDGASGGGGTDTPDANIPDASGPENTGMWTSEVTTILGLIIASAVLSFIASKLSGTVVGYWIAVILAAIAAIMAVIAIAMAIKLMGSQMLMGSLYLIGGGLAATAAVLALVGASETAICPGAETIMILAAGAGVVSLIGSMLGGAK